ncbi:MAG: FprA family A-type flavoprotein [Clostridiales bacterium]|jgi:flavorubredoxin|nr:FprA family A-type flavoprotein [Clostridiales bacterium]
MDALKIKDDIYWAGSLDYDLKVFDIIMHTDFGTTYNAYVIKGHNKNVLVEISKDKFFNEFFERLKSIIDPADIDYIVLNHTEPDHSGSLKQLLPHCPKAVIAAAGPALRFLKEIVNEEFKSIQVSEDYRIDIGGKTLRFIMAPFLHWPDTMFTYVPESRTLFTCDAFGCHYCDKKVFNDLIEGDFYDAYKYYFDNILGPFKKNVLDALEKIKSLQIETICNGHGPVIRKDPQKYIDMYRAWAAPVVKDVKAIVIAYVSAYGYTKQMAQSIADGLKSVSGVEVSMYDFVYDDINEAMNKIDEADGILLGSPTLAGDALPVIYNVLTHLNPYYHKGKIIGLFGSYGWSGEAVPNMEARVKQLKLAMPLPGLRVPFCPSERQLKDCAEFGEKFGRALKNE